MDIRNRMASVVKLRCNACQDFLVLVIKSGWQEKLYKKARYAVINQKHSNDYISAYEKMGKIGITNYRVADMDVSIIAVVVKHCKELTKSLDVKTIDSLLRLKDDRNTTNHSDENERPEELYLRGLVALCDLRNFVRTVYKYEFNNIEEQALLDFYNKYINLVDDLQELMDDERIELIQKKKKRKQDIQLLKNSPNQEFVWNKLFESYVQNSVLQQDNKEYIAFITEAAEAGLIQAYSHAANHFYSIKEYDKAEKYLAYLYSKKQELKPYPDDIMRLADIYINKLSKNSGDGYSLISELISEGNIIKKSDDGNRYEWLSKRDGRCMFSIQLPQ